MPRKTNSLADALRSSVQPEPEPKRPQGKRGQRDGNTRLVGAHFPEPVHRQLRLAGHAGGPQHALRAGRGALLHDCIWARVGPLAGPSFMTSPRRSSACQAQPSG